MTTTDNSWVCVVIHPHARLREQEIAIDILINKAAVIFMWATPRWRHQAILSCIMKG